MPLEWRTRPGPRMRRTLRQARATYVSGEYEIRWHGSTHGIWELRYKGRQLRLTSLLADAKRVAVEHARQVVR